jgi:uncharacterized protein
VNREPRDDVREDVAQVVELQTLDLEITRLQREVQKVPLEIAELEQQLQSSRQAWERARERHASIEQLRRRKERELEDLTAEQRRRQTRLFEIKTNQEYTAVLKEIDGFKERRSKLEDEILELFDQIEAAQGTLQDESARVREREAWFAQQRAAKDEDLKHVQSELERLMEERRRQASLLEPGMLQAYQRLLRSRGGIAVVPVKDGSCLGCHVALTPQTYHELRRGDVLITCANCQRILYWNG